MSSDLTTYIESVGENPIAEAAGVTRRAVRLQHRRGWLPARWFFPMKEAGLDPPETLFAWSKDTGSAA
jgi:hypothetical protein